ncbi:uncharacterized protein DUF1885 [Melghiribacillus thermohalophilus]|uniref:Uncharacterized protein DUF1885 n=1 Tax=Melghiribacillus thermohalophilus TaxID=1324956 RepID=A0A4V2V1V1_9BACI|nr:DUF1885 family protein [Melghiribacillus thermohalophilus]TCT22632.1 uncharacterized protein DUF1885 [Melghiribacillus thermohalophilus]
MGRSAYIYPKKGGIQLEKVKELLSYFQQITTKTGEQLNWKYDDRAFPYTIEEKVDEELGSYLLLKGKDENYDHLLIGVNENEEDGYVQITLPESATHGDKGKGNELAKFLAKKIKGNLKLFNGRVMPF